MARRRTVAQLIVDILVNAGAERVYGIAGDSLNGITDAIYDRDDIKWIPVRHEEAAAFAAGAEAHLTGRLAVCAGSCGPGHLHLINGLFDCHRSRVPVLAIAAHIPSREIGSGYFQETHPERLFADCSHFCEVITSPAQVPRLVEIAVQTAIAKSGVSVLVLPGDVALLDAPAKAAPRVRVSAECAIVRPQEALVERAAKMLNDARRVTILAGAGCRNAHAELLQTADALAAPIVHAMRGKEYVEHSNPFDVGMTGLLGFSSGYLAMKDCDTLLMLGTDFPYQQFYPDAPTIQVDLRGEQLGRRTRLDLGIVGDVKTTLEMLLPRLIRKDSRKHLEAALAHYAETRRSLDDLAIDRPAEGPIHPQYVARTLDAAAADDAIFTCDVGTPTVWAARYLTMNGRRRLLGSFSHGSMANALPQAIGAQLAHPDRQVISLSGDGGLAMLMGELLTLKQVGLPVKVVVFTNASLGFVQLEMQAAGFLDRGVELSVPDFAKIAEAAGMLGIHVQRPGDLPDALWRALSHNGPALVDARVHRQELVMPPSIQLDQVGGFALYMARAVLSGRGDSIVDLAKTNLLR